LVDVLMITDRGAFMGTAPVKTDDTKPAAAVTAAAAAAGGAVPEQVGCMRTLALLDISHFIA
jgi:hypothetical protein